MVERWAVNLVTLRSIRAAGTTSDYGSLSRGGHFHSSKVLIVSRLSHDSIRPATDFVAFSPDYSGRRRGRLVLPLKSERVELSLNSQAVWYLDSLIELGLYGNTRAEAAKIVLFDHCKLLIAQGKLTVAPPVAGSSPAPRSNE
jgi:hypothetical protein